MESATMKNPVVSDNPMVNPSFEKDKARMFDDIFKDMHQEADGVRRLIVDH